MASLDCTRSLLKHKANTALRTAHGCSALHLAAGKGAQSLVEELLEAGLLVDELDSSNGWTPLHYAVLNKHEELASWLLDKGADPASIDKEGFTPIFSAISVNSLEMTKALLRYKRGWQKVQMKMKLSHLAATQPTCDILECLNKEGLSIHEEDNSVSPMQSDRAYPIHYAAFKASSACLKYLIDQKINVNIQDARGSSPLHLAVTSNSEPCVKILCEGGADVDLLNSVKSKSDWN